MNRQEGRRAVWRAEHTQVSIGPTRCVRPAWRAARRRHLKRRGTHPAGAGPGRLVFSMFQPRSAHGEVRVEVRQLHSTPAVQQGCSSHPWLSHSAPRPPAPPPPPTLSSIISGVRMGCVLSHKQGQTSVRITGSAPGQHGTPAPPKSAGGVPPPAAQWPPRHAAGPRRPVLRWRRGCHGTHEG